MFYRSIIDDSRSINVVRMMIVMPQFGAYLTDDARSIIYYCNMFIMLATGNQLNNV
jgi:hypothetical protein